MGFAIVVISFITNQTTTYHQYTTHKISDILLSYTHATELSTHLLHLLPTLHLHPLLLLTHSLLKNRLKVFYLQVLHILSQLFDACLLQNTFNSLIIVILFFQLIKSMRLRVAGIGKLNSVLVEMVD